MIALTTRPCPVCGERSQFSIDQAAYIRWERGAYVQDAFPHLTADERELLMTGTHPACWEKIFREP